MKNYLKYRGKCKELCELELKNNSSLTLVRGYYHCPVWGKQAHWWLKQLNGTIVDPSIMQFPSWNIATKAFYEEFNGMCECANCGKEVLEEEAIFESRYAFCSGTCLLRFVGL